jgi:hypothetical protein
MTGVILAAMDRAGKLEAMRRGFTSKSEPDSGVWLNMLLVILVGLLVVAALLVLNRIQQGKKENKASTSWNLFREVMDKLSLSFHDRSLLRNVAAEAKLTNPTLMFLTPELFAEVVYSYTATKTGKSKSDLTRLASICKRLFGRPLPRPQPTDLAEAGSHPSVQRPKK